MWSLESIRQVIKVGPKAAATAAVALFRAPGNHRGPHRGDTYVPCLNFKTHSFVYWGGTYIPVVTIFAIFFVNVGHSFYPSLCLFHHFRCLRSLFQGHLACWSFTLTGPASLHDQHDTSGATLWHFGTECTVCWDCGALHLYIIPDSCSCILQVRYSRHYRHKIPTLSQTNYSVHVWTRTCYPLHKWSNFLKWYPIISRPNASKPWPLSSIRYMHIYIF